MKYLANKSHQKIQFFHLKSIKFNLSILMLVFFTGSFSVYAKQDSQSPPPVPVKIKKVKEFDQVPSISLTGTIYSQNQLQLTAGVAGRLDWVASPGSQVKKGDLIAQIELLPLQLRQAEKNAQYKRAKINLAYLKKELKRQRELRAQKNTSQLQLEQTESQVEIATADIEIAELQLKQINQQLARATVTSPFDGVITQRIRRAGYDVGPSDILVHLLDIQNLEVRAFVPVKYITTTKLGADIIISNQSNENGVLAIAAKTSTIIPAVDPLSQTFEIRIKLPQEKSNIWSAGQLVKVKLPIASTSNSLIVHRDSLILRSDGIYVVKIDEQNVAHRIKVTVSKGENEWVAISGDIMIGDKIAVRGAERITDGQLVKIMEAG